jgi:hypothetical protein
MGLRNRFDDDAYEVTSTLFDSREPLIAKRGMGIYAPRNRQPRKDTPEYFHSTPRMAVFLGKKFPYAILPLCKLRMRCQCGPCTFPWYKPGRPIPVADCEFHPPCRACRDTVKMMVWVVVIVEWFLLRETDSTIERVHRWKLGTVNQIVQKIRRQLQGERQDGLPRTGNPRGRPKRKSDTATSTVGGGGPPQAEAVMALG